MPDLLNHKQLSCLEGIVANNCLRGLLPVKFRPRHGGFLTRSISSKDLVTVSTLGTQLDTPSAGPCKY